MNEPPKRTSTEPTLVIDRHMISDAARSAIERAAESYPEIPIEDRPTLVRCPEQCHPCACCHGQGMVTAEQEADWKARRAQLDALDPSAKRP